MKVQIRPEVFETNSSSVHALTVCTKAEYEAFKNGELLYNNWYGKLVSLEEKNDDTFDYDEFQERGYEYGETYSHQFTTPSGDEMVAFGYYGHD